MGKKKKGFLPDDIEDLETIFYGSNKNGKNIDLHRQRRYLDWSKSQIMSPAYEQHVKTMFSPLGKMVKIPENKKRPTFDYKIDNRRMLIEVTSLNIDETSPGDLIKNRLTKDEVVKKLSCS